jgi:hypothetical protein
VTKWSAEAQEQRLPPSNWKAVKHKEADLWLVSRGAGIWRFVGVDKGDGYFSHVLGKDKAGPTLYLWRHVASTDSESLYWERDDVDVTVEYPKSPFNHDIAELCLRYGMSMDAAVGYSDVATKWLDSSLPKMVSSVSMPDPKRCVMGCDRSFSKWQELCRVFADLESDLKAVEVGTYGHTKTVIEELVFDHLHEAGLCENSWGDDTEWLVSARPEIDTKADGDRRLDRWVLQIHKWM